jgi:formylglycine-generating enzyme required for sulfatase activity
MFTRIPSGYYKVGISVSALSEHETLGGRFYTNVGERRVFVRSFRIRKHPVTVGEYFQFLEAIGSSNDDPELEEMSHEKPVTGVSQLMAMRYSAWTSGRLPTAIEWEAAARGTRDDSLTRLGTFAEECLNLETPITVGSRPECRNQFGLQELVGGVLEWCSDRYEGKGILKGTPFNSSSFSLTDEVAYYPKTRPFNAGFRYVLD